MTSFSEFRRRLRSKHVIEADGRAILFDPETYSALGVGEDVSQWISRVRRGDEEAFAEEYSEVVEYVDTWFIELEKRILPIEKENEIPIIYLNIASACNLRCLYCYANFGKYQNQDRGMTTDLAIETVRGFFEKYGEIGGIVFFGGEPSLYLDRIEEIVLFAEKEAEERGAKKPRFSMVTNGTRLSSHFMDFMAKRTFGLTISCDGPKEVHDYLRPKVGRDGSFDEVEKAIHSLVKRGIKPGIEVTITKHHLDQGWTPIRLMQYFQSTFGIESILIAPVADTLDKNLSIREEYPKLIRLFREATRYSLESLLTKNPIRLMQTFQVLPYLEKKMKKAPDQFCYAKMGKNHFSVSSDGNVYPCQMMNDQKELQLGSIGDLEKLDSDQSLQIIREVSPNKEELPCGSCWAKNFCFMCIAGVSIETGKFVPVPKHRCDLLKGMAEEIVLFMTRRD